MKRIKWTQILTTVDSEIWYLLVNKYKWNKEVFEDKDAMVEVDTDDYKLIILAIKIKSKIDRLTNDVEIIEANRTLDINTL